MTKLLLAGLESESSFALLGAGFTGSGWRLLRDLRVASEQDPVRVAFAGYEDRDGSFGAWTGEVSTIEPDFPAPATFEPLLDDSRHSHGVRTIRDAIAAGDVYQVNLTLRASLPPVAGSSLLARLCARGVPRFAAWVRLPDGREFVSASPELFFEVEGRRVVSEPMKGTASAGNEGELRTSGKDEAELAMITDLVRNDLAPVCVAGSVRVEAARAFHHLPYAVQAVSRVVGELQEGVDLGGLLRVLHPGGSVTGAPKPMAMRMIGGLEATPRGAYCGTLVSIEGARMVASLLIRTAERTSNRAETGWIYGVGGGIVWDSDAAKELAEVHVKLGALR